MRDDIDDSNGSEGMGQALDQVLERYGWNDGGFNEGIVLVQIPQVPTSVIKRDIALNQGYFVYPPQGLLYLSALCERINLPSRVIDLNYTVLRAAQQSEEDIDAFWKQELDQTISEFRRPIIGVSFMFDSTRGQLDEVLKHIRQRHPGLCIIVGGVAATANPEAILNTENADIIVHNEGENPLADFYAYVRQEKDSVPENVSVLDADGQMVQSVIRNGGEVEFDIRTQYDQIDIGSYNQAGSLNNFSRMRGVDVPFATVLSRRGCRAHCTFCAVRNFNGRSVRVRRAKGVVDEMQYLWDCHGVRHFEWLDDDLLYDRDNAIEMFHEISRRLPEATWCANNGLIAAAVNEEMLKVMQDSGCQGFTVGLETGNEEMLRKVRKPASLERFALFARITKNFPKIFYIVNFILGLPDERIGQMLDSLAVGMQAQLDWMNLFNYQPLRNTDAYLAFGGMDTRPDDSVVERGTTVNFNPIREGVFEKTDQGKGLLTGYDVFDLDAELQPNREQVNEIWFTFNSICNFARLPAIFSDSPDRVRNAIKWLEGLQQAYSDNPTITCLLYYLSWRLNDRPENEMEKIRSDAVRKFNDQDYWRERDVEFQISAFLDRDIPPLEKRAIDFFSGRNITIQSEPSERLG